MLRAKLAKAGNFVFITYSIFAAFGAYFCMYAFRKPFSVGTFDGEDAILGDLGYKSALVMAQVMGYALSKFIGIKIISELRNRYRAVLFAILILIAELALVLFAVTPAPWNIALLFLNGLPLGMIWGIVFSYLEGRRFSEILGAGLSVLIGMTLGLFAGFFGGWVDEAVMYVYQVVASIPYLLLLLAIAFVVRQGPVAEAWYATPLADYISLGLFNIILVIGTTSWVTLCRLVRAEVMKVRELEYVQAARALGFGEVYILFKHVLPNVFHLVIINFSLRFVTAIKSEVILTFLGVGVDKEPSWGQMIADAKTELMRGIWWPLLFSGLALFLLTLAVNYVGDALRDALDPKLKHR